MPGTGRLLMRLKSRHRFARRIKNGGLVLITEVTLKKPVSCFPCLLVLLWLHLGSSVRVYIQDIAPQPAPPTFLSPEHSDYHFPAPSCRTRSARNKVAMWGKSRLPFRPMQIPVLTVSDLRCRVLDHGSCWQGGPMQIPVLTVSDLRYRVMVNEADKQDVPRSAL